ncbi:MAG: hypothetical protein NZO58_11590, partial [Gemmataceae bacterium]|nr:hypothetical protein [Gemmataceae bacterium]
RPVLEAAVKDIVHAVTGAIKEGGQVTLALDLNSKSKDLTASIAVAGKPGTDLARVIQELGQAKSRFAGWRENHPAMHGLVRVALPTELNKALGKLITKGLSDGVAKLDDAARRAQAQQLVDALLPTLTGGELDACLQLIGPSGDHKYTLLAGVMVKNGGKLGTVVHDLVADLLPQMPESQRKLIKLNHAEVGAVKVHRFELLATDAPLKNVEQLVGEPVLHLAFRDDAMLLALGKDGLAALKKALAAPAAGASPVLSFEMDVARLARLLAPTDELKTAAAKIFTAADDGQARLTVEAGGALKLTVSARLPVVQFLSQTREFKGRE